MSSQLMKNAAGSGTNSRLRSNTIRIPMARPPCMPNWRSPTMRPTSKSPKRKPKQNNTRTRAVKVMSEIPTLSNVLTKTDHAIDRSGEFPYAWNFSRYPHVTATDRPMAAPVLRRQPRKPASMSGMPTVNENTIHKIAGSENPLPLPSVASP